MPLTDETRLAAKEIVARYPRPRSALLPMLHLVQSEDGYVSPEGVRFCAEELGLTKAEVGAVATFYTMYKRRPTGDYLVSVCTNTLCDVLGGQEIYDALSEHLGVGHDQTTADGRITLEHAECLAACDYAPVVTVNYEFFDQQTTDSAMGLVGELQSGGRPLPTRGAPLCTFKEISRQLAGFIDDRPGAVDGGQVGEPTLVGNRLAVQRGETAPAYDAPAPLDKPTPTAPTPTASAAAASAGTAPAAAAPAAAAPAGTAPAANAPAGAAPVAAAPAAPAGTGPVGAASAANASAGVAGAGAASAATDATTGERPAAATTPAEQSAAQGTARYGGPPEEPSSGGGEGGGRGLETSASDPDADAASADGAGSGVAHEADAAKAGSAGPDAPTADGPEVGTGRAADAGGSRGGTAPGETEPGHPGPDTETKPRPTNRGRKTTRREG